MIFSLSPGTDKNFIGDPLYSSHDSVMKLIRTLRFFTACSVFYKTPEEKINRS
jgi:hypothetical protein